MATPKPRPVIAHHLILTCYGFWLPNDERGSGSHEVWSDALRPFGPGTHVDSQASVARRPHDPAKRRAAKQALKHSPVRLSGQQANAPVNGFGHYLRKHEIPCYACAILPDHAHLVLARVERPIERIAIGLKAYATRALLDAKSHPFQPFHDRGEPVPKLWARDGRHVFLFDDADVRGRIGYVERNPTNAGLKRQRWSFVVAPSASVPA